MGTRRRSSWRKVKDTLAFPLRAVTLFHQDRWGLTSLASERFDYVSRCVRGRCLDVGCGPHNRLVNEWLDGQGSGIDVYAYEGLTEEHIVKDIRHFPFPDESFMTATFIANLNHVPRPLRDVELAEAFRVLMPGGNIIVTMGNPAAELLVHKVVALRDRIFGTRDDMDGERGMEEEEEYYLLDREIASLLARAGFIGIRKKRFWTQWALNHLLMADKPAL